MWAIYSSIVEWSQAFGGVPIHLHAADREAQPFHSAVRGDALALCFQSQAAVGLFFARNADVADGVCHGVSR